MGLEFPVICDSIDCRSAVFNSTPLCLEGDIDRFNGSGVELFRINVIREKAKDVQRLVEVYDDVLKNGVKILEVKYKGFMESMQEQGFTRGHFFRGV